MKRNLSPRALFIAVICGVLVYALVFWFVLVGPKRAEASALKAEVAALDITVANARIAARCPNPTFTPSWFDAAVSSLTLK